MPKRNNRSAPKKGECVITEVTDYGTHASVKVSSGDPLASEGMVPIGNDPLVEEGLEDDTDPTL